MVTEGLQLPASSIIAGSWRAVDFASLVSVAHVVRELLACHEGSTQRERGIVQHVLNVQVLWLVHVQCGNAILPAVLDYKYPLDPSLGPSTCKLVAFSPHNIALPIHLYIKYCLYTVQLHCQ